VTDQSLARWTNPLGWVLCVAVCVSTGCGLAAVQTTKPATQPTLSLKVVTYNVHGGRNHHQLYQTLHKLKPDLLCLQEAPATGPFSPVAIARTLGMKYAFQGYYGPRSRFGCAILARGRVRAGKVFSMPGERNFGLTATVTFGSTQIKVVSIHLKSLPRPAIGGFLQTIGPHAKQARIIVETLKDVQQPVILAGDTNTLVVTPAYATLRSVLKDACVETNTTSQPSILLDGVGFRIDHVMFKGPWRVKSTKVIKVAGSDHLPVMAEMVLIGSGPARRRNSQRPGFPLPRK